MLKPQSFFRYPSLVSTSLLLPLVFIVVLCRLKYPITSSVLTTCTIIPSFTFTHPHSHFCTIASFWIPKVSVIIVTTNLVTCTFILNSPSPNSITFITSRASLVTDSATRRSSTGFRQDHLFMSLLFFFISPIHGRRGRRGLANAHTRLSVGPSSLVLFVFPMVGGPRHF